MASRQSGDTQDRPSSDVYHRVSRDVTHRPSRDMEKAGPELGPVADATAVEERPPAPPGFMPKVKYYVREFEHALVKYNLEARGIQRVMPEERHSMGFMQIGLLWFSINLAANNVC